MTFLFVKHVTKVTTIKKIIADNYIFLPFACETLGPWCDEAVDFVNKLGKILNTSTVLIVKCFTALIKISFKGNTKSF